MFTSANQALAASLCALLFHSSSEAQPVIAAHTLRALDAKAAVPPLRHVPVLARAASSAAPALAWREANQAVDAIGGWKAYAREAAAAPAPAASASGAKP